MTAVSRATPTVEEALTIDEFVARQLGCEVFEIVECRSLYNNRYRVNWKNRRTGLITRSQFLVIKKVKNGFAFGH